MSAAAQPQVGSSAWVGDGSERRTKNWQEWEVAAAISAHRERAEWLEQCVSDSQMAAAVRGLLWERHLKHALRMKAAAREHWDRIKDLRSQSAKSPTGKLIDDAT